MEESQPKHLFDNLDEFNQKVTASKGKVVVLVHPFYNLSTGSKRETVKLGDYTKHITLLALKSKTPVVIFEDDKFLSNTFKKFGRNVFFIQTSRIARSYDTRAGSLHGSGSEVVPIPKEGWPKAHDAFTNAKVKDILIGGMYAYSGVLNEKDARLSREKDLNYKSKKSVAYGCVGGAYIEFAANPKYNRVRVIPNALYPFNPMKPD